MSAMLHYEKPLNQQAMNNDDLTLEEVKKIKGNPLQNKNAILLVKQEDGNWRGFIWKGDKLIQARQGDPQTVMTLLITHP